MSRFTPPGSAIDESQGGRSGVVWTPSGPILKMQDAVVETIVTHTTRTTTSFAPIPLPRIPIPESVPMPSHLTWENGYPLAQEPTPDELKYIELKLGDRKVIVQEDGMIVPADQVLQQTIHGKGWTRNLSSGRSAPDRVEHTDHPVEMGFTQYVKSKGKEKETDRKRPHDLSIPRRVESGFPRPQSPPRKKIRPSDMGMVDDGAPVSPPGSPDDEGLFKPELPQIGNGVEVAALLSLPSLLTHFEQLPDKIQQHVLMHMFRRARMPTIQTISQFASTALKRDFITLLPHEIAIQVLKKLDVKSLAVAANVSRAWRKKIDSERSVWRTRLVEDGLWYGQGVEDEEEKNIVRRYEVLDQRALRAGAKLPRLSKAGTPSEDEPMTVDMPATSERATPLKHIYRRRFTSDRNWLHATTHHTTFAGHGTNVVTCVQFDDDKIVSASDDHSINIYDLHTGVLRKRLDGHEGGVWALEYKGDTLVTGSTDRSVRIWDLEELQQTHLFWGHTSTVRCLQIVEPVYDEVTGEFQPPYPLIVTGSRDASLRVWKLPKKGEPSWPAGEQLGAAHAPPEQNPFHVHALEGHGEAVRALAAHGRICVSGSYDRTVRVWDIVKGTCIHVLHGHESKVYSIVYDKYRNRCASGSMDNTVKIWNLANGECLHTLTGHTSLVGLLGLSPNRIVSAAADASLRVWDANTYELKHTLSSHAAAITCFQHDETKVVSGSDGTLKLWDIKTGRFICDLITGISSVWQVAFHGNILVAASNRNGNTVFDVFDFGNNLAPDPSGVDDDSLDLLRRQPWERGNPREPQTYQVEDEEEEEEDGIFCVGSEDALSPKTVEKWRAMSVRSQKQRNIARRSRFASAGATSSDVFGSSTSATERSKRPTRLGMAFGDRVREGGDRLSARDFNPFARVTKTEAGSASTEQLSGTWSTGAEASTSAGASGSGSGAPSAAMSGATSGAASGDDGDGDELGLLDTDVQMGGEDVE